MTEQTFHTEKPLQTTWVELDLRESPGRGEQDGPGGYGPCQSALGWELGLGGPSTFLGEKAAPIFPPDAR